jgi:hypothetical protein
MDAGQTVNCDAIPLFDDMPTKCFLDVFSVGFAYTEHYWIVSRASHVLTGSELHPSSSRRCRAAEDAMVRNGLTIVYNDSKLL